MSVYLMLLFICLVFEMGVLFILVLPLPYNIRKVIANGFEKCLKGTQLRTIAAVSYILVGILFLDSWKRASLAVRRAQFADGILSESSSQLLVTQAYHQRNLYLSGFVLYFSFCIPVVLKLLNSYVRRVEMIPQSETQQIKDLQGTLREREASLEALKAQKRNLEAHFNAVTEAATPAKSDDSKKND